MPEPPNYAYPSFILLGNDEVYNFVYCRMTTNEHTTAKREKNEKAKKDMEKRREQCTNRKEENIVAPGGGRDEEREFKNKAKHVQHHSKGY